MKLLKTAFYSQFFVMLIGVFISSCQDNEIGNSRNVNPETVFLDYRVWGDGDSDEITVMLQYRFGGVNGTTLVLEPPARVEFDGDTVAVDSSKMSGAYYEVRRTAADFAGKHTIVYTDLNKKEYREVFEFPLFNLKTALPAVISRAHLVFELEGLQPVDYVQVLLTDTSFYSKGIDRTDTVSRGRILITKEELSTLRNGPIHLEFYHDNERALKERPREGGKLSLSYGIKKQFELVD